MDTLKNSKSLKPLIMVIISSLIIVILGIVIAYALNQGEIIKEKDEKIESLQKKVNSLTDNLESLQTNVNQEESQIQSKVGPWPEYINDVLGFSLTFPEDWNGYLLTEGNGFIDFGFEDQNPGARINFISHEQWEQIRKENSEDLKYLGETEEYVFIYNLAIQFVDENIQSLISQFPEITDSFTLLEGELIKKDYSLENEDIDFNSSIEGDNLGEEGNELPHEDNLEDLDNSQVEMDVITEEDPSLNPDLE